MLMLNQVLCAACSHLTSMIPHWFSAKGLLRVKCFWLKGDVTLRLCTHGNAPVFFLRVERKLRPHTHRITKCLRTHGNDTVVKTM